MAYYNRFKDVEIALPNIGSETDGEYRMEAFKGVEFPKGSGNVFEFAGTRRLLMDWTPNLITNNGLDSIGDNSASTFQASYCHVGTGNTPPTNSDTSIETYVASKFRSSFTPSAQSTAPYYGVTETRYLFSPDFAGTGAGVNLNEIGVSANSAYTSLTSRALTVDGAGTPTTISVLADEYLECYYRRRNYPAHLVEATGAPTDDTGVVNVEGVAYDYTIRPIMVTYGGSYSTGTGDGWGTFMYYQRPETGYSFNTSASGLVHSSTCALGAVTSVMSDVQSGTASSSDEGISGSYTSGTYSRELYWQWAIGSANEAGGIGGLTLKTMLGAYQLKFDTPIPKVYGQVFTFYHNFTWDRKTSWV